MVGTFFILTIKRPSHNQPINAGQKRIPIILPTIALTANIKFQTTAPAMSCRKNDCREIIGFMLVPLWFI